MRIARFSRDDTVAYGVVQEAAPDGVASRITLSTCESESPFTHSIAT